MTHQDHSSVLVVKPHWKSRDEVSLEGWVCLSTSPCDHDMAGIRPSCHGMCAAGKAIMFLSTMMTTAVEQKEPCTRIQELR